MRFGTKFLLLFLLLSAGSWACDPGPSQIFVGVGEGSDSLTTEVRQQFVSLVPLRLWEDSKELAFVSMGPPEPPATLVSVTNALRTLQANLADDRVLLQSAQLDEELARRELMAGSSNDQYRVWSEAGMIVASYEQVYRQHSQSYQRLRTENAQLLDSHNAAVQDWKDNVQRRYAVLLDSLVRSRSEVLVKTVDVSDTGTPLVEFTVSAGRWVIHAMSPLIDGQEPLLWGVALNARGQSDTLFLDFNSVTQLPEVDDFAAQGKT